MRGKPFEPGNKAGKGRPAGSRNKKSIFLKTLEGFGVPIIQKGAYLAITGDRQLLRVCFERLIAPAQPLVTHFRLPKNEGEPDMKQILTSVLKQTSTGGLSPHQAVDLATFAETYTRMVGELEHDDRLADLEDKNSETAA